MRIFIDLCGFFGMWSLFSFPLYQAVLELSENFLTFEKNYQKN